jgi:hypothetical protein
MTNPESRTIKITAGDSVLTATMYNNAAANDFLSLLPLFLTLTDYAGIEKVSDLPRKLSTKDAPVGYKPSVGELTYYAPWGNLAVFCQDFGYARGLVPLARINTDIKPLKVAGPVQVKIEQI